MTPTPVDPAQDERHQVRFERALDTMWLVFQPIVSLVTPNASTIAYEALCRTSETDLVDPRELLRLATSLGQVSTMTRVVRERAAEVLRRRLDITLFINVDVEELLGPLEGEDPIGEFAHRVVLEVTERSPISRLSEVRVQASALRERGYRFALDDLGGGYAGLSSLALIEPEFVKIDRALVRGLDKEPVRRKIIASLVGLCRQLRIACIAGGVETEAERDALLELHCELMQGYLFGRPVVV